MLNTYRENTRALLPVKGCCTLRSVPGKKEGISVGPFLGQSPAWPRAFQLLPQGEAICQLYTFLLYGLVT